MGYGSYDSLSRSTYEAKISSKSMDEIFVNSFTSRTDFKKNSKMTPHELGIRESRDSKEHPNSIAIIIALDVTGSMGRIPNAIVKKDLSTIMNTLIAAGVEDTQILFMGIGDHIYDRSPMQVGQFESSDELMAKWLEELDIESGGGGNMMESYNMAWLLGGHHTSIDCWEKRKRKGFIFTIGDEKAFDTIQPDMISNLTGTPGEIWTDDSMLAKAQETYHVYHIHADDCFYRSGTWAGDQVIKYWKGLIGENLIISKNYTDIAQHIADVVVAHKDDEWTTSNTPTPNVEDTTESPNTSML